MSLVCFGLSMCRRVEFLHGLIGAGLDVEKGGGR